MSEKQPYRPVPVVRAENLAVEFCKDIVLILTVDHTRQLFHTTTFAKAPAEKELAHTLGERAAAAIGADVSIQNLYEDFRDANKLPGSKSVSDWLSENIEALSKWAEGHGRPGVAAALRTVEREEVWL